MEATVASTAVRRVVLVAAAIGLFAFGFAIDGISEVGHHAALILGGMAVGGLFTR